MKKHIEQRGIDNASKYWRYSERAKKEQVELDADMKSMERSKLYSTYAEVIKIEVKMAETKERSENNILIYQAESQSGFTNEARETLAIFQSFVDELKIPKKFFWEIFERWCRIRHTDLKVFYYNPLNPRHTDGTNRGALKICAFTLSILSRQYRMPGILAMLEED